MKNDATILLMNRKHIGTSLDKLIDAVVPKEKRKSFDLLVKKKVIARQIKAAMQARGITRTELARQLDVGRQSVDRVLDPARGVSLDLMCEAAFQVGIAVDVMVLS